MWNFVICVFVLFLIPELILAQGPCKVKLGDLSEKIPVYELDNGELVANQGEELNFVYNQNVYAICRGINNSIISGSDDGGTAQILKCVGGVQFSCDKKWIRSGNVNFGDVECKTQPPPLIETKDNDCGGQNSPHTTVDVSVQGSRPHLLMRSCFDRNTFRVLYTAHQLTSQIKNIQRSTRYFITHDMFKPLRMDQIYIRQTQFTTLNTILGGVAGQYLRIRDTDRLLEKGHLAPLADFALSPMQKASNTHFNAVPQWAKFNRGNWKTLEMNIRNKVVANNMVLEIYTGTFATLTLSDQNNNLQEIYLSYSPNGIPVPLWFYKVVRDITTNKAVVFLGLNNPFVSIAEARTLGNATCQDVCNSPSLNFLTCRNEDTEKGYITCCRVEDFIRRVNVLPHLTVSGLF